jgi:SSS family solute:Na+ symporter
MNGIDLVVFLLYLIGISIFGGSFFKKNKTSAAFTLGNGNIPGWVVTMSIFATFVSSISYLALPGIAYMTNWNAFVFSLSIPIAAVISIRYFIPVYRKINSPSAYTYIDQRFGSWARIYVSLCYILTQVMRVGTILYLLALALHTVIAWSIAPIIILTGVLVALYSVLGGIQAVVWTDAIQGIILIVGAVFCALYLVFAMPEGPLQIFEIATANDKFSLGSFGTELSKQTFWVVLVYGIFINLQNYGIDQNYVQRYMASKSDLEAKKSAFLGGFLYLPVSALFLFIGTGLYAYYSVYPGLLPESILSSNSGDVVFPFFIVDQLPVGLRGLLVASIFAAGMSTVSTSFNSTATVILTDFYRKYFKNEASDRESLRVLYGSTIIISIIGISIGIAMINVKSALDTWWKLASVFSGGMLGLLLLGMFTKVKKPFAAIVGVLAGILVILWLSLSNLLLDEDALGNQFHSYLTIVFGTAAIFLVGFAVGIVFDNKTKNKVEER